MKAMVLPLNEALILFATDYYDVINMFDIHFMKFDKYVVIWLVQLVIDSNIFIC